jgi:outer membrane protein TolC
VEAAVLRRLAVRMERVPEFRVRAGLGPGPRDVDPTEGEELRYFQGVTIAGQAGMTLPITTFGKIQTGTALAEAGIELERVEEKSARLEARYEAYRAYLAAQWSEDARELLDDAEGRVDEAEESLLNKMDEGDYTVRNDLRQIDMLRADLLSMRNEVERSGFLARTGLRIVLNVDEETSLEPFEQSVAEVTPPPFEAVFDVAQENRPELERAEIGVRARELELQLEKKNALPDVFFAAVGEVTWTPTLEGRPTISEEANNFNELSGILALGVRWELNPGVHRARVRRLEERAETMRITQDAAEDSARLNIREAYLQAVDAYEFVEAAERAKRSAEAWLNQTGFQFEQGLADFEEFEDPLKAYYERTAAYLRAVLTYRLRVANLAVKCGVDDLRHWPGMNE